MIENIIRQLRIREKKEASDLAQYLKTSLQNYLDWEDGNAMPEDAVLQQLAQFYNEDIYIFFKQDCVVSMHDQRCTKLEISEEGIRFFFPKGIYLCMENAKRNLRRSYRTAEASVFVHYNSRSFEPVHIQLFEPDHQGEKVVRDIELQQLAEAINNEKRELEFVTEYKSYWTELFECVLWSKTKPYAKDCQIYIDSDRIEYEWTELAED